MTFAKNLDDLERRVGSILLGCDYNDERLFVHDMGV